MLPTQTATVKKPGSKNMHKLVYPGGRHKQLKKKKLKNFHIFNCRMFALEGWGLLKYIARQLFIKEK
jgi:hypothetical protein